MPSFALGAVFGLAVLQRTNLAVLVPVALGVLAVARRGDGIRAVAWAGAGGKGGGAK